MTTLQNVSDQSSCDSKGYAGSPACDITTMKYYALVELEKRLDKRLQCMEAEWEQTDEKPVGYDQEKARYMDVADEVNRRKQAFSFCRLMRRGHAKRAS